MEDCIFCKIIAGEIPTEFVYQDDNIVVFKDLYPKAPVHLLVVPKAHVASLSELKAEHEALMGRVVMQLPEIAATNGAKEFRTIVNTGSQSGQEIFHLHFHILGGGGRLPGF